MKTLMVIAFMYLVLILSFLGTWTLYLWSEYRINHYELIERKVKHDCEIDKINL